MTSQRAVHPWQQTLPVAGLPAAGSGDDDADAARRARIALSLLVEPGDAKVGAAVQSDGAVAVAAEMARRRVPHRSAVVLDEAVTAQLQRASGVGAVCLVPGSAGWPSQLDDLGDGAPLLLWVRGDSLRADLWRSVSIVGSRACSPYGRVQAETLASELALFGWTVVSGGAYGIDAAAHNGALAVGGRTVVVSAGGVDRPYPRAHDHLYARAAATGAVVSECPLGAPPAKHRFLSRNRLIAAMSRGTVVVEAALRSGARSTATAAAELARHVMAMPGPVTSDLSRGCHEMIRDGAAVLVGGSKDVLELVTPLGENDAAAQTSARSLLGWLASQGPSSLADIAAEVGMDESGALALLTVLEGAGYATQSRRGWTMTPDAMARFARRM